MPFTDGIPLTASALNDATPTNWTAFTPTFSQSVAGTAIGKTVTRAKYTQMGKIVIAQVLLQATGAGSAGNAIEVGLPVAAASANAYAVFGSALFNDANTSTAYSLVPYPITVNLARFMGDTTGGGNFGAVPAVTVAVGDYISYSIMYEAA